MAAKLLIRADKGLMNQSISEIFNLNKIINKCTLSSIELRLWVDQEDVLLIQTQI
jgi:hypothetical protein